MTKWGKAHRQNNTRCGGWTWLRGWPSRALVGLVAAWMVAASPSAWAVYKPEVGLAKQASTTRQNADGTYSVDFSLRMQNLGSEPLVRVQIVELLAEEIAPATIVAISQPMARGALRFINPDFNGTTETYLLTGQDRLEIHEEGYVEFTLTFDANGQPGPFFNRASAWTQGEKSGIGRDDKSQNGTDPDPDTPSERPVDNINPQDNSDPTPINLPLDPVDPMRAKIGLAKSATPTRTIVRGEFAPISDPNDGARRIDPVEIFPFVSEITLVLENLGPVPLVELNLFDDLQQTFPRGVSFQVLGPPVANHSLMVNPQYDGATDTNLLASGNSLDVGATAAVTFAVAFDPADNPGPFANSANVTGLADPPAGSSAPGDPVEDTSDNGTVPDPDGDGEANEPGENDPTPIEVPLLPEPADEPIVGLAKAATIEPLSEGAIADGELGVSFILSVRNYGTTPLLELQVLDSLATTFAEASQWRLLDVPTASGGLRVNSAFDGDSDTRLLAPVINELDVGQEATITLNVGLVPARADQEFINTASVTGFAPDQTPGADDSTNGLDPDPNGDGNPDEAEPTPVDPPPAPVTPVGPGALAGTVFFDTNHDDTLDGGEQRLAGWRVVVYDDQGRVVGETGPMPRVITVSMTFQPVTTPLSSCIQTRGLPGAITAVEVVSDATVRADLPVDPQGRIYDSQTRVLVPGTTIRIYNATTGSRLPDDCLLPNQQDQTVGADAAYRFDVIPGADGQCPGGLTEYRLEIMAVPSPYLLAAV